MPKAKPMSRADAIRDVLPILAEATKRGETVTRKSLRERFFPNMEVPPSAFGGIFGAKADEKYGIRRFGSGKSIAYDLTPAGLAKIPIHTPPPNQPSGDSNAGTSASDKAETEPLQQSPKAPSDDAKVNASSDELEESNYFDVLSDEDARTKVTREIAQRRGRRRFRDSLEKAYGRKCAVTGCGVLAVLEAAHIRPYRGDQTDIPQNGLLLRADIHTLFDLNLIAIDPTDLTIYVAKSVDSPNYQRFNKQPLRKPNDTRLWPAAELLEERWREFTGRIE